MTSRFFITSIILLIFVSCHPGTNPDNSANVSQEIVNPKEDAKEIDPLWSKENTLVCHITTEPDNLHPTNGNSAIRSEIMLYTQELLLNTDYYKQVSIPGLAKSLPEVSADGLEYTYELRDEPRWDDGSPVTADDIIFTAKAYKCPLTNDPSVKSYWTNLKLIRTDPSHKNQFTLVMKKKHFQNVTFLTSFAIMERAFHDSSNILSGYSLEQFDDTSFHAEKHTDLLTWSTEFNNDKYGRDPKFLNGLGPYKVEKWEPGQSITLLKKKNYWGTGSKELRLQAYPEKIIFRLNKDENSTQLEFKSQTYDVSTIISTSGLISLSQNEGFRKNYNYDLSVSYNYTFVAINERPDGVKRKKLFTDPRVRHALALISPVDNMTKMVYKEYSAKCKRMVSNVVPIKRDFDNTLTPVAYDPEQGKKLLAEAGWKDSDGDGILDQIVDGTKIQMTCDLAFLNTSPDWKDMSMLLAEEFKKAGISLNLVPLENKVMVEKAREHDFDLMMSAWASSSLPEDFTQIWHTASWKNKGSNYPGFGTDATDALIDSIKAELDDSKRIVLSKKLQHAIYDDQPYIFLFTSLRRNIVHKRFGNLNIFADRPGILLNTLRLLSTGDGITMNDNPSLY